MQRNSKYKPLADYLQKSGLEKVTLSFNEIEKILGFKLDPSARKHRANWSNNEQEALAWGWLPVGYKSCEVDINTEIANFIKNDYLNKKTSKKVDSAKDEILLDVPDNLLCLENDEFLMVKLNKSNSDIVENEIENDPGYRHIGKIAFDEMHRNKDYSKESYFKVINKIATENNTRTSKKVMELLANYCSNPSNSFLKKLEEGKPELVDELLTFLVSKKERKDKSLASKICRYMNEWLYNKDAFTINDSVVRKVLPYYLAYYKVDKNIWFNKKLDDMSYVEFFQLFESLKVKLPEMNRHQLDHLMWYSYKNDPIRSSIAEAMVDVLSNKY